MTTDHEKRSRSEEIAQGNPTPPTTPAGVGGRHGDLPTFARGGGYLKNCTAFEPRLGGSKKIARDPRLDELQALGLHPTWQKVAAEIGMDAFLAMWRLVDQEQQWHHPKGTLEIPLRHYASYLRYQRNQYIRALSGTGLHERQIHYRLLAAYGEKLEPTHIKRIAKST